LNFDAIIWVLRNPVFFGTILEFLFNLFLGFVGHTRKILFSLF